MADTDPIGIVIEAHARELHAALADVLDGVPGSRALARQLLAQLEEMAQENLRRREKHARHLLAYLEEQQRIAEG